MAPSRSSICLLCLALAPLLASADVVAPRTNPAPAKALLINPQQPYQFDAASCDTNYKTHATVCRSIVLSQGNTRVRADHAQFTCMNCQDSRWTLQGNVRIEAQPSGNLRSDQATVEVRDNRIVRATVTGSPAEFEQQRADNLGTAKGHADQIVYDVDEGTVLLTNDAWLSDGRNEMSGPSISYNIREQKVRGSQGVHITIMPQNVPKPAPPPQSKGTRPPNAAGPPNPAGPPDAASTPGPAGPPHAAGPPPPPPQTGSPGPGATNS